jgi:hypothetical protein
MKIRKRKKILLGNIKNNRPFEYHMMKLALKIREATLRMSQALQKVYTEARNSHG